MKTMLIPLSMLVLVLGILFGYLEFKPPEEFPVALKGRFRSSKANDNPFWKRDLFLIPESEAKLEQAWRQLAARGISPDEISHLLEHQFPLRRRLQQADEEGIVLPGKRGGEWVSIRALKISVYDPNSNKLIPVDNFTPYPDELFIRLREIYFKMENADQDYREWLQKQMAQNLIEGYGPLAGTIFYQTAMKDMRYPSWLQLKAETFYYKYSLIPISIALYVLTAIMTAFSLYYQESRLKNFSFGLLWSAFICHTIVLALRCLILARPPVSNMFETVVYVPWVAVGLTLIAFSKLPWTMLAASLASAILLFTLEVTHLNSSLENVQAVLDSHYWLIIHVLMVVGSYGLFVLGGILAHFYLIGIAFTKPSQKLEAIAATILQCIYVGTALLICGTILGGVWAAESWGRFWDWDPKEAWAFISSCVYLMGIHAYTFQHIGNFGLAVTAIIGLQAISFTWYGVNYILGTGLHSYGFGSGGEITYYSFLIGESLFLLVIAVRSQKAEAA